MSKTAEDWAAERESALRDNVESVVGSLERIAQGVEFIADVYDKVESFDRSCIESITNATDYAILIGREPNGEWYAATASFSQDAACFRMQTEVHGSCRLDLGYLLGYLNRQVMNELFPPQEGSPF